MRALLRVPPRRARDRFPPWRGRARSVAPARVPPLRRPRGAAGGEISAIGRTKLGGDVRARVERTGVGEPLAAMREPGRIAPVGFPFARRALDRLQRRQQAEVLLQPAVEQPPLPEQRLVRRLDGRRPRLLPRWPDRARRACRTTAAAPRPKGRSAAPLGGMSERRAILRRGLLLSGSIPASQGMRPRRSSVSRASRSLGGEGRRRRERRPARPPRRLRPSARRKLHSRRAAARQQRRNREGAARA